MEHRRPEELPELVVVSPDVYRDERGFFLETWRSERYASAGVAATFVQDNHSRSERGVLRGLHYQHPHPQGKLVHVTRGEVFDVAVDIRRGSPTFSSWFGLELSGDNHRQLWIPEGFAHGFVALSETVDFLYKCTKPYQPEAEHTLRWDDPDVGIDWPIESPRMSGKDRYGSSLEELRSSDALPTFSS